jgi:hypothetical protein
MLRRLFVWLSEVVWTAVLTVVFVVLAVVLSLLGFTELSQIAVVASIPFAILSIRS